MGRHCLTPGHVLTPSENAKKLRAKRVAKGKCPECGLQPPRPNLVMCQDCSDDKVFRNLKCRAAKREGWYLTESQRSS